MQRVRNRRPSYLPQATKPSRTVTNTKTSAGGSGTATGSSCSTPPEQVGRSSRAGGDEVLRAMGGGYLTVTVLCTLSRALLMYTTKQAADNGQKLPYDGHPPDNDVDGQFRPAREVAELLSLLASLFQLGSPSSQVRERCVLSAPSSVRAASRSLACVMFWSSLSSLFEGLRRQASPP